MGDPLSTASVIAGIISLGLTVTGGLVDYYSAWKDGDEDIASTSQAVARLDANLHLLKDSIQSNTVKRYAATEQVNASITQCEAGIVRLQKLLEKIKTKETSLQGPDKNESMRKLGDQGRRLLYPFRRGTLGKLRDVISELSDNLTPVVHALQIDIGVDTLNDLRDLTENIRTWRLTGENQRILSWLSPLDFQQRQKDILSSRCPDTGSWFLDSEAFRKWRDRPLGSPPGLWCTGKMGAGKSSLTSLVIDHLQSKFRAPQFAIAYVYCDWQDSVSQSTRNLVGSLLQQLVQNEKTMPSLIKNAYGRHKEGCVPLSVDEGLEMIGQVTKSFQRTFICIDGLDECGFSASEPGEGRKMRSIENALLNLLEGSTTTLTSPSVFVTSRFQQGTRSLTNYYTSTEISASTADLRTFIKSELTDVSTSYSWTNADLAEHVTSDQKLLEDTIHRCLERADNMFLLPKLHVALLKDQCNLRKFRIALNSLPYDLGESIRDAFQRIQTQSPALKELGLKALLWTSCALRPLRVNELQHALAVEPDDEDFEEAGITSAAVIVGSCAGLMTLDSSTRLVRLVNCSIRQYLDEIQEINTNAVVIRTCCLYLGFPIILESFEICDQKTMDLLTERYPLVTYASEYWGVHAKHDESNLAGEVILRLLRNSQATDLSYHCMYNSIFGSVEHCSQGVSGLHLAAFFGLDVVVKTLLASGALVDVSDSLSRTPLYIAAANGQATTVKLLHCAGAKVSGRVCRAIWTHALWTRALLPGTDTWWYPPWAQASERGEALQAAADAGHLHVVDILLAAGADVNRFSGFHQWALDAATFRGHGDIVQSLLNHGACTHRSTIQAAVYYGDPEILQLLVERLPEGQKYSTATKDDLCDALYAAALADRHRCAQYLIEQGVNVNENTKFFYRNALQAAASQAYIHMMNLLIENGANVNNFDELDDNQLRWDIFRLSKRHGSALQSAAYAGHDEAISLLLSHGAELNEYSGYYGTSLQSAACQGHLEIVRGLIKAGSHINTRTGFFGNPLQAAAAGGYTPVVELLLASGAHVNAQGGIYGYPLNAAARSGNLAIVKLLVNHGADVNAVGGAIGTALSAAAIGLPKHTLSTATTKHLLITGPSMTEEWIRMHRDKGMFSNIGMRSVFGNILHIAAGGSFGLEQDLLLDDDQIYQSGKILKEALATSPDNADIVEYLLNCGAHPNQSGGNWNMPIIAAAYAGRLRVVKLLLSRGADVHSIHLKKGSWDFSSATAIRAAANMGHKDIVKCLQSEYGATFG